MENQTLQQFKDIQRRNMQEAISKGKFVNSVTGFECSKILDRSIIMNENRRIKKKWAKQSELKEQE